MNRHHQNVFHVILNTFQKIAKSSSKCSKIELPLDMGARPVASMNRHHQNMFHVILNTFQKIAKSSPKCYKIELPLDMKISKPLLSVFGAKDFRVVFELSHIRAAYFSSMLEPPLSWPQLKINNQFFYPVFQK